MEMRPYNSMSPHLVPKHCPEFIAIGRSLHQRFLAGVFLVPLPPVPFPVSFIARAEPAYVAMSPENSSLMIINVNQLTKLINSRKRMLSHENLHNRFASVRPCQWCKHW